MGKKENKKKTRKVLVEPLIMDTLKSGQPPCNGHTVRPLPIYIPTSKEGTTSENRTKYSFPTCPFFGGSTAVLSGALRLVFMLTSVLRVGGERVNLQSGAVSLNKHLVELCDLIHSLRNTQTNLVRQIIPLCSLVSGP